MLYRAAGSPKVTLPSKCPYTDVKRSDVAFPAIYWATKNSVIPKYSANTFRPTAVVVRRSVASHLYQYWWRFS